MSLAYLPRFLVGCSAPKIVPPRRANGRGRGTESSRLPARRPRYQQQSSLGPFARPASRGLRLVRRNR
jgi:hypothetical protein